jgi:dGTPase
LRRPDLDAPLPKATAEREVPEDPRPRRDPYQSDQDRIIQCNAFRRLAHKTQVFLATSSDHFRSRLTHTLEVSRVARTLARGLNLNEDLAEAISLGHDLGHTPFGHAGERALNRYIPGGFHHQRHSVRIVTKLANDGLGLNLTKEVIDGIGKHSKGNGPIFASRPDAPFTPEGQIVRASDIIAYLAHDLDDALESDLISPRDVPSAIKATLGRGAFDRVWVMVDDLLNNTTIIDGNVNFSFSPRITEAMSLLRTFLYNKVYQNAHLVSQLNHATGCICYIFMALMESQELYETMPRRHLADDRFQAICDFIAGMTDRYAMLFAQNIERGVPTSKLQEIDDDAVPFSFEF